MNCLMNETRVWYCHICDKTNLIKRKLIQINSKKHKHKEKIGTVVKENEFFLTQTLMK